MTKETIIDVYGNSDNGLERAMWLRDICAAASQYVRDFDEPLHEACYWPHSIENICETPSGITVYWSDAISMSCFRWAFEAAWSDLGDDTPVLHVAIDDLRDDLRDATESGE